MTLGSPYEQALAHRRGDLVEAERLYRQVLEAAPASFAARHMLGVLKAQTGATAEALELIGAALALKPDAPDALFNYGNVLKRAGRLDEALAAYEQALALQPDFAAARAARAEGRNAQGNALREAGQFLEALSGLRRRAGRRTRLSRCPEQPRRGSVESGTLRRGAGGL